MSVVESTVSSVAPSATGLPKHAPAKPNPQIARATPRLGRFLLLVLQLALLVVVYHQFRLEEGLKFYSLHVLCLVGFAIHYFVPFAQKKQAFFGLTLIGAFLLLGPSIPQSVRDIGPYFSKLGPSFVDSAPTIGACLLIGLVFFGLFRLPVAYSVRLLLVLAVAGGLVYARWIDFASTHVSWAIVGMVFMFRMILFAHEVKISKKPESLNDFLNYFFILPNFVVPIFPIIDYSTFKKGYYVEDIHTSAQRGIFWMARGALQLCVHRYIYHNWVQLPEAVDTVPRLIQFILVPYLLYIRISGQYHIITGMMHLFGYKLPETYRKYFLAENFTDFWRRINIYWKDFMIKVFYYPAYFRLRKRNETLALVVATLWVFTATILLHAWQYFWLANQPGIAWKDIIFWGSLGVLVLFNVLRQARQQAKGKAAATTAKETSAVVGMIRRAATTLGVFLTIAFLWSIWSSIDVQTWWKQISAALESISQGSAGNA